MMQLCNSVSSAVDVEGFGQTGPYVKRGGFDNIAIAIGGLMNITGPEVYLSQYNKHGCSLRNYCAGITDKQVNFTVLPLDVRYASAACGRVCLFARLSWVLYPKSKRLRSHCHTVTLVSGAKHVDEIPVGSPQTAAPNTLKHIT